MQYILAKVYVQYSKAEHLVYSALSRRREYLTNKFYPVATHSSSCIIDT
jgi:hypothetical protein